MSEGSTDPNEQAGAEFDADVAMAAQRVVDDHAIEQSEHLNRPMNEPISLDDDGIRRATETHESLPAGEIVDRTSQGSSLRDTAGNKKMHDDYFVTSKLQTENMQANALKDEATTLIDLEIIDAEKAKAETNLANSREAAKKHLELNRAGYETIAIEDANAAGHDINFGGQTYPATDQVEKK